MSNWHYLSAVTKRQFLEDLKLAVSPPKTAEAIDSTLARVHRVLNLYDGLGALRSLVALGEQATEKNFLGAINKWRNETQDLVRVSGRRPTQGQANLACMPKDSDDELEEEGDDKEEELYEAISLPTSDVRSDQQVVEFFLAWRPARDLQDGPPNVFHRSPAVASAYQKFNNCSPAARGRILARLRAALSLAHRHLARGKSERRENQVLNLGVTVDQLEQADRSLLAAAAGEHR